MLSHCPKCGAALTAEGSACANCGFDANRPDLPTQPVEATAEAAPASPQAAADADVAPIAEPESELAAPAAETAAPVEPAPASPFEPLPSNQPPAVAPAPAPWPAWPPAAPPSPYAVQPASPYAAQPPAPTFGQPTFPPVAQPPAPTFGQPTPAGIAPAPPQPPAGSAPSWPQAGAYPGSPSPWGAPGWSQQPPSGTFQQPSGTFQQPSGTFQQPSGTFQQPFQQPSGTFQQAPVTPPTNCWRCGTPLIYGSPYCTTCGLDLRMVWGPVPRPRSKLPMIAVICGVILIAFAGALLMLNVGGGWTPPAESSPQGNWQSFSPPDHSWTAMFPGTMEPQSVTQSISSGFSGEMTITMYVATDGKVAYEAASIDIPASERGADPNILLDEFGTGVSGMSSQVKGSRTLTFQGHDARESEFTMMNFDVFARYWIANERIYLLMVMAMPGQTMYPEHFFDGFKLN